MLAAGFCKSPQQFIVIRDEKDDLALNAAAAQLVEELADGLRDAMAYKSAGGDA